MLEGDTDPVGRQAARSKNPKEISCFGGPVVVCAAQPMLDLLQEGCQIGGARESAEHQQTQQPSQNLTL